MAKFIPYDYNQHAMVVVNFQDQIQPGTFEYALHFLIEEKLDLSVFDSEYNNDDNGRLAYDPAILLKIILFAYSKGITSSRQIEWCCKSNIIFKALSCDTVPHFTTIASLSAAFLCRLNGCSNKCCWYVINKACWVMSYLPSMVASCRAMLPSNGQAPSRS